MNEKCVALARTHGATFTPEKYQLKHITQETQANVRRPKFQDVPIPVMSGPTRFEAGTGSSRKPDSSEGRIAHVLNHSVDQKHIGGNLHQNQAAICCCLPMNAARYGFPPEISEPLEQTALSSADGAEQKPQIHPRHLQRDDCPGASNEAASCILNPFTSKCWRPSMSSEQKTLRATLWKRPASLPSSGPGAVSGRRFRKKGNMPIRHIDQLRGRAEAIQ